MHLCEVRRFMRNFVVYVNNSEDIKILKNDDRFWKYAVYNSRLGLMGIEYTFKCHATTIAGASKYVNNILKKERKEHAELSELPARRNKNKK